MLKQGVEYCVSLTVTLRGSVSKSSIWGVRDEASWSPGGIPELAFWVPSPTCPKQVRKEG